MASFRWHISTGIALGVLGAALLASFAVVDAPSFLIVVLAMATLGSVLPDMDSDSGVPFHVAFGSLSIVCAALVFITVYRKYPGDYQQLVGWALLVGIGVWGIVGYIFKRFTRHRGIAHSIPAVILGGLITFFLATRFYFSDSDAFILAVALMCGYLSHLVLDEIYAAVNFQGRLFEPNKAFGSAMKLKSHNAFINLAVFGAIILLAAGNVERFISLAKAFWEKI